MAVYFDHRLDTERSGINTDVSWYSGNPLLAVTSYSDETGGSVNLFLEEVSYIDNDTGQISFDSEFIQ